MSQAQPDSTVEIGPDRSVLRRHLGVYLLAAVFVLLAGFATAFLLDRAAQRGSVILLFGLFVFLFAFSLVVVARAAIALRALAIRGPVVTIGPDGLRDRRISSKTLPWSGLAWRCTRLHGRSNITLFCDRPPPVFWPYRLVSGPQLFARGKLRLWLSCSDLERDAEEVAALLARFHAAGRRDPDAGPPAHEGDMRA